MAIQNDKTELKTLDQPIKTFGMVTNGHFLKPEGIPRTRKKVAIVGFAPSSMQDVRVFFGDPAWEIWSINQLYIAFPAIAEHTTRWFQIHPRQEYDMAVRDLKHHQWMAEQKNFPIYMQEKEPDIPMAIPFPKDEILTAFPRKYFTNSISWEIALAILEGFEEIHVYGIDMSQDQEYCLGPDSKILTDDLRWVPISEVKVGDKVIAFDESRGPQMEGEYSYRQWRVATVEKANVITRPCYRVHLSDGTELISSQEHRWLTYGEHQNRWKTTEDLITPAHREGRPTNLVKVLDVWDEDRSWEAGYLAGAFDGEGCLTQTAHGHCNGHNLRLGFGQLDNPMSKEVCNVLDALGFDYGKSENNWTIKGGRPEIMRFLGQIRPRRLLDNFNPSHLGSMQRKDAIAVERIEFIGEQEVIALKTSEGTFVAEGFASHNSEQRPSVEYFIGWADALGIKVRIPPQSDLCKTVWLYPFEDDAPMRQKIDARRTELRGRVNEISMNEQNMRDTRMQMLGALDNMNYVQMTWSNAVRLQQPGQMIQKR